MKNVFLLPTDKPSNLWLMHNKSQGLMLLKTASILDGNPQHLYITSDETIKDGLNQWYLDKVLQEPYNSGGTQYFSKQDVIVMTTDLELIADGIQAIDDEFLQWYVDNPSCEYVDLRLIWDEDKLTSLYKIRS